VFEDFERATIETAEATIRVRHGGSGPALLLLHGHPQTHVDEVYGELRAFFVPDAL